MHIHSLCVVKTESESVWLSQSVIHITPKAIIKLYLLAIQPRRAHFVLCKLWCHHLLSQIWQPSLWQVGKRETKLWNVIVLIVNLDIIGENGSFPCCDGRHQSKDIGHLSDRLHCVFSMTHGDSLNCWLQLQSTQLWQLWSFLVYKHYAGLICIIGYFLTTVTLKGCMYHEFYR